MVSTAVIKVDRKKPDFSKIRELAKEARAGKLIAFPTETVYGIGAPMSVPGISEALIALKKRDSGKPFSYHIGDKGMVDLLGIPRTPVMNYFAELFWPGPVTLVVKNQQGGKVGLRYPKHPITAALFNAVGEPFIATSANLSDTPSALSADEVMANLNGRVDYIIDDGITELHVDSTVLDLTENPPKILRRGAAGDAVEEAIENVRSGNFPHKHILVVCTGNSCRSPMAEGWIKHELIKAGLQEKIKVKSCGIGARKGALATPEAILVMRNREIDISDHEARVCSREDVIQADLIIAMSREHTLFISGLLPSARQKIVTLDISDPIGMGIPTYEEVFNDIEGKLKDIWREIIDGV